MPSFSSQLVFSTTVTWTDLFISIYDTEILVSPAFLGLITPCTTSATSVFSDVQTAIWLTFVYIPPSKNMASIEGLSDSCTSISVGVTMRCFSSLSSESTPEFASASSVIFFWMESTSKPFCKSMPEPLYTSPISVELRNSLINPVFPALSAAVKLFSIDEDWLLLHPVTKKLLPIKTDRNKNGTILLIILQNKYTLICIISI